MATLDGDSEATSCNDDAGGAPDPGTSGAPSDARYWVGAASAGLSAEHNLGALATGLVVNTAGVPSVVSHGTNTHVLTMVGGAPAWAAPSGGGGGAPVGSTYVVISLDGTLTNERALAVTSGHLALTDGGANGNVTLGLPSVGPGSAVGSELSVLTTLTPDAQGRIVSAAAVAGTANQVARVNSAGTAVGFGLIVNANVDSAAAIAYSKLADMTGPALLGRVTGTGAMAAITATTDGQIPVRFGGNLIFGQIQAGSAAGTTTDGFVLTLSSGVPTWLAASGGVTGSGAANRLAIWSGASALTSDAALIFSSNSLQVSASVSGGTISSTVSNTSNSASSKAISTVQVAGSSADDAYRQVGINGGVFYAEGVDNSVTGDPWTMSHGSSGSATLGTNNIVTITPNSTAAIVEYLQVNSDANPNTASSASHFCVRNPSANITYLFFRHGTTYIGAVGGTSNDTLKLWGVATVNIQVGANSARASFDASGMALFGGAGFGSGVNVVSIANRTTAPTADPSGGGILYIESGALMYRGSSGTITTICPA